MRVLHSSGITGFSVIIFERQLLTCKQHTQVISIIE
jgi:hypothetical protein